MKKDLILKFIKTAKFVWKEAEKPILRINSAGKLSLLPSKNCAEEDNPRLSYKTDLDLTLVHLLLGVLAMHCICSAISRR